MDITEQIKLKIISNKMDMRLDIFLKNVLFNSSGYYYKKKPIGKFNDFITAPEISQMFGEIIGLYLYYLWSTKIKSQFNLIELGPGNGTLFTDIANTLLKYPEFLGNAIITFVEINESLIKIQKKNLKNYNIKNINWRDKINFRSNLPSIIYSNEFFDCFPVRQFFLKDNWFEKYVTLDTENKNFIFKNKLITEKKLLALLSSYNKEKLLEISFERNKYFEKICKLIKNKGGVFFTIDYGYLNHNTNFTLQAIQNHKYSNVLENIGEKDISSLVNFEDLINIALKNNLYINEFCTQREFLIKFGILEREKKLSKLKNPIKIKKDLKKLIGRKDMGNLFKCLVISNI